MNPVRFSGNTCYVLSGGDILARYHKREELVDAHPGADMQMEISDGKTYLQFLTGQSKPLDSNADIRARAQQQGHIINLDA